MRLGRGGIILLLSAGSALAAYQYDFTGVPASGSPWTLNGTVDSDNPPWIDFYADSGAFIYQPTVTGVNGNDYEVSATLSGAGYTTAIEFLRASQNTLTTPYSTTGSYISVEVTNSTIVVNQCVSGSVTQLASVGIPSYYFTPSGGQNTLRSVIWGTTLWVFFNNQLVYSNPGMPATTGQPGIGGRAPMYQNTTPTSIISVSIGHHDVVAPGVPSASGIRSSILPNSVSLAWPGVLDDAAGVGLYRYAVSRNGGTATYLAGATPLLTDSTVQPSTTYTYAIQAQDFHGNLSAAATYSVTTPPATSVDPRRVGIFTTGSYWGGGGEQIDTLSGNLNFSLPLVKAQGRTGWGVPVGLSYNSQNWRYDGGVNWQLGEDTGFGFGWSMQIGSITPYYAEWTGGVDHYIFTDGTGAQYRLDQSNGNVWSSLQGIYVWFDANTNRLHFKDGTFWLMGCTSSGGEQDAGTMYPTIVEDSSGNEVIVTYQAAVGFPAGMTNTSARITGMEDVRATAQNSPPWGYQTYAFTYNTDPVPHLTGVTNTIGTAENFPKFSYAEGAPLTPPFGQSAPNFAGATTTQLTGIEIPATGLASGTTPGPGWYQFAYDASGNPAVSAAELLQVTFPWGGHLRWVYSSAPYQGGRLLREVSQRYLATDFNGTAESSAYSFAHSDSSGIQTVHTDTTLADASGVGAKTWTFNTASTGSYAWEIGLVATFTQLTGSGGTALTTDTYTWGQTPGSTVSPVIGANPYIMTKVHSMNGTTTPTKTVQTSQTTDAYGNVTGVQVYPFGASSGTALQNYQNTYLSYPTRYVLNRLSGTTLTAGGATNQLVQNLYDQAGYNGQPSSNPCSGSLLIGGTSREWDGTSPSYSRGLLTQAWNPAKSTCAHYDGLGNFWNSTASDGSMVTAAADPSTNYAAPTAVTTESYNTAIAYNSWLGVTQTTGANGEQLTISYDNYGRPVAGTSPYSTQGHGIVNYYYSGQTVISTWNPGTAAKPAWQQKIGSDGVTETFLDGLGRTIQVLRGDSNGPQTYTNTVYAPCACSPLGKLQQTSQPQAVPAGSPPAAYISGSAPAAVSYTYDGIGRTLTVTPADGVSVTTYSYSGNTTKVTDPAGNSKTFTTDELGNLISVTEPDPANQPSGTLTTTYTYDWMNHLTTSTMTRLVSGANVTQTRTFVYNSAGQLTSATNPESGTVTYTYNTAGALATKVDANNQTTGYTYNSTNQVTAVTRTPSGSSTADPCQTVNYTYGTNGAAFNYNRLVSVTYGTVAQTCVAGTAPTSYAEQYTYNAAGGITQKLFWMNRVWSGTTLGGGWWTAMTANYMYDWWGNLARKQYTGNDPFSSNSGVYLWYTNDTMGRPSGMTDGNGGPVWVQGVTYDVASRVTAIQYPQYSSVSDFITESKSYNLNGQLASMTWTPGTSGQGAPSGSIAYSYTGTGHTGNNGQVVSVSDGVSGENIAYQYDVLKRLTSASSAPQSGSTPASWSQSFSYDGFGNLTGKTLGGVTTAIPVNAATNQLTNLTGTLSNVSYDSNGNLLSVTNAGSTGLTMTYDEANRVASATVGSGTELYGYAPDNKRVYRLTSNGTEEWTFFGAMGEKLGTFQWVLGCDDWTDPTTCQYTPTPLTTNIWFGSKLLWSGTGLSASGPAFTDRLGTNRAGGARFRPYGDEITATGNDREKFATYQRDSFTGLDYADQRYYASAYGRFITPDSYGKSANPRRPGSWNRYAYASNDPVNRNDPSGKIDCWSYYLAVINNGYDPNTEMGNCADAESATWDSLDPCTVSSEVLEALNLGVSCDAAPPCYQAENSSACSGSGSGTNSTLPPLSQPSDIGAIKSGMGLTYFAGAAEALGALDSSLCDSALGFASSGGAKSALSNASYAISPDSGVQVNSDGTVSFLAAQTANNQILVSGVFMDPATNIPGLNTNLLSLFAQGNNLGSLTTSDFQAIFLLHELGHISGIFGNDLGNPQQSMGYTTTVIQNCFPDLISQ